MEKATSVQAMFRSASAFNSDLSSWNVEKVEDFGYMFKSASSYNSDMSFWNMISLKYKTEMLFGSGVTRTICNAKPLWNPNVADKWWAGCKLESGALLLARCGLFSYYCF